MANNKMNVDFSDDWVTLTVVGPRGGETKLGGTSYELTLDEVDDERNSFQFSLLTQRAARESLFSNLGGTHTVYCSGTGARDFCEEALPGLADAIYRFLRDEQKQYVPGGLGDVTHIGTTMYDDYRFAHQEPLNPHLSRFYVGSVYEITNTWEYSEYEDLPKATKEFIYSQVVAQQLIEGNFRLTRDFFDSIDERVQRYAKECVFASNGHGIPKRSLAANKARLLTYGTKEPPEEVANA